MTTYNIDTIKNYCAEKNLRVRMIMHDDFDLHETYVVATDSEDRAFSIVYVASDNHLDVNEHESRLDAVRYITEVAEHTFHMINDDCNETLNLVMLAKSLRESALRHVRYNVEHNCKHIVSAEMIDALS